MRIKVYHLLFLLLLSSFAIPARGQESEKTNQKLQTEIEALRAEADSLQVQLMEWTTKVSASAKQLEVLTRSVTMMDVRMLRKAYSIRISMQWTGAVNFAKGIAGTGASAYSTTRKDLST